LVFNNTVENVGDVFLGHSVNDVPMLRKKSNVRQMATQCVGSRFM